MQDEQDKYFTFAAGLDVPFQRYSFGSTTTVFISGITTGICNYISPATTSTVLGMNAPSISLFLSSNTNVYISCDPTGTGTLTACGTLTARRRA